MNIAAAKEAHRVEAVVARHVALRRAGTVWVGRCPFHPDGGRPNLVVFPRTQTWACFVCGAQGDVVDFVARIHGCSLAEALRRLDDLPAPRPHLPVPGPSAREPADPARRDRAYRQWLAPQRLAPAHAAALRARGLSAAAIARHGFVTLRPGPVPLHGDWTGVPGFYRRDGRWWASGPPGLLIPVRDAQARLVAAQIRVDGPAAGGKYRWWSSAGRPGGTSPGAPAHVARPPAAAARTVWVTEGPLKAIVAAEHLGAPVVGIGGVTAWRAALAALADLQPRWVILAFDQDPDPDTRRWVARHARALGAALAAQGLRWAQATWDPAHKGLDDALAARRTLTIQRA